MIALVTLPVISKIREIVISGECLRGQKEHIVTSFSL